MRKLILISAFVLAAVSAQAGEIRELILAVNDITGHCCARRCGRRRAGRAPARRPRPRGDGPSRADAGVAAFSGVKAAGLPFAEAPAADPGPVADPAPERRAEGTPDRRAVWRLLVMRNCIIVAVMFRVALVCQNSHRDVGDVKIEAVR